MPDLDDLLERLSRVQALCKRPGTEGERLAAEQARRQILAQLAALEPAPPPEPPIPYSFRLDDETSRRLMEAILSRHGYPSRRSRGVRSPAIHTTVTQAFVEAVLWPEYRAAQEVLQPHIDFCIRRVVADLPPVGRAASQRRSTARGSH